MRTIAALLWLALTGCAPAAPDPPAAKPELALLTSLPILFGEQFTLEPPPSPLRDRLERDFRLTAVDGPERLPPGGLLLAIQPQALTAERLVALDRWVRAGGRLVLLADPQLRFESERPLGDRFRPPYTYPDTGLLARWGLRLEEDVDTRTEAVAVDLGGGARVTVAGMGRLARVSGSCMIAPTPSAARCKIGRGHATVIADADFAMSPDPADHDALIALVDEVGRR